MGNQNVIDAKSEKELMKLVNAYIDNGAPAKVIAAECGVNWGLFQHYLDGTSNKRMLVKTFKELTAWLNMHDEHMPKDMKRCTICGKVKPLSEFYKNAGKKDGRRANCSECSRRYQREHKKGKEISNMANNNTEVAMTAEIVKKVKAEDNTSVSSTMLAPYFGITPKQLEAIRKGEWDSLLYKKEPPKPAVDVKNAVEALRMEIADMHYALNRLMAEIGCAEAK